MSRSVSGVGRGWSRSHYQTSKRGSLLLVMGFAAYLQFGYAGSKVNLVEAAEKMPADAHDFRPSEMGANLTETVRPAVSGEADTAPSWHHGRPATGGDETGPICARHGRGLRVSGNVDLVVRRGSNPATELVAE